MGAAFYTTEMSMVLWVSLKILATNTLAASIHSFRESEEFNKKILYSVASYKKCWTFV